MRHGLGKGAIYERRAPDAAGSGRQSGDDDEAQALGSSGSSVYIGAFEGMWAVGLRHGRGFMLEVRLGGVSLAGCTPQQSSQAQCTLHCSGFPFQAPLSPPPPHTHTLQAEGDRYEGEWSFDLRHGEGVESIAGGGSFRGCWCRGVKHGSVRRRCCLPLSTHAPRLPPSSSNAGSGSSRGRRACAQSGVSTTAASSSRAAPSTLLRLSRCPCPPRPQLLQVSAPLLCCGPFGVRPGTPSSPLPLQ